MSEESIKAKVILVTDARMRRIKAFGRPQSFVAGPATNGVHRNQNKARLVMKDFIQTTFKTSDGVKLSYLRAGNGLPVILLHGFLEERRMLQITGSDPCRAIRRHSVPTGSPSTPATVF